MEFDIRIGQHIGYDIAVCLSKRILRNGKCIFSVYAGERSPISVIVCRGDGGTTVPRVLMGRVSSIGSFGWTGLRFTSGVVLVGAHILLQYGNQLLGGHSDWLDCVGVGCVENQEYHELYGHACKYEHTR